MCFIIRDMQSKSGAIAVSQHTCPGRVSIGACAVRLRIDALNCELGLKASTDTLPNTHTLLLFDIVSFACRRAARIAGCGGKLQI